MFIVQKLKAAAELWKSSSAEVLDKYRKMAQAALEKYHVELEAWEEKMISSGHMDVFVDETKTKSKSQKSCS